MDELLFRSKAGNAEEAWRYECVSEDYKSEKAKRVEIVDDETINNKKINTDIIRGNFSPYLAFNDTNNYFKPA
jgi:hypothetical protein